MKIRGRGTSRSIQKRKIIVIGIHCVYVWERRYFLYYVLKQKENGATIEGAAKWAEENKLHICHDVTVDASGNHLHRGGRVSKTSANTWNNGTD